MKCFISVDEIEAAFKMSDQDFSSKYGFSKPGKDSKVLFSIIIMVSTPLILTLLNFQIVTSCLKGGRAANAAKALTGNGYNNVDFYKGSLEEWKSMGGNTESG